MRLTRTHARGFTLLELGVVIGVIAVLSAALVPSVIEAARSRMAARAADEVKLIHEAARWYYLNPVPPNDYAWPGQVVGTCNQNQEPLQELFNRGALSRSAPDPANPAAGPVMRNPWNHPYVTRITAALPGGTADGCMLQVSTWVATTVAPAFADAVQGRCDNSCGAPPPVPQGDFTWCCAFASRPSGMSSPACVYPMKLKVVGSSISCAP